MSTLKGGVLAAAALAVASAASAQLALTGVRWQVGDVVRGRVEWTDAKTLGDAPPKLVSRIRAKLQLKNGNAAPVEGVLLRYSMTLRLKPGDDAAAGTWAIPFSVEEKRVPVVAAGKTLDVFVDPRQTLDLQLRHVARAGWWPDRIKMQVMLEPRRGATAIQTAEDVVELKR
jgi:hypothetical protein